MKLRSNYKTFKNRCSKCGHRTIMHDATGICRVEYNGELPKGEDKKCGCKL